MTEKKKKDGVVVSAFPMLAECPCYESDEPGAAARFGSLFHDALEHRTPESLETKEAEDLAKEMNWSSSEISDAYDWGIGFEDSLIEKLQPDIAEREVMSELSLLPGRHMKMDVFLLHDDGRKATIVDWKTGRKTYEADTNEQGWGYVFAMFEQIESLEEATMIFASPFVPWYDDHVYTREDVDWLREALTKLVKDAKDKKSKPKVCDFCKWCRKSDSCEAVTDSMSEIVAFGIGTDELPEPPTTDLAERPKFPSLEEAKNDPVKMSYLKDMVPFLKKMIDEIKKAANEMRFEEGIELPGYRVAHRKASRRIVKGEVPSILLRVSEKYGLDIRDLLAYVNIDVKNLEKAVGESAPKGAKAKQIQDFMDECVASGWVTGGGGEGTPYLVKTKRTQKEGA